jgi:hypothetical protein
VSIGCGTVLAVRAEHVKRKARTWRQVAGTVFILGFVLLGLAIGQWPDVHPRSGQVAEFVPAAISH